MPDTYYSYSFTISLPGPAGEDLAARLDRIEAAVSAAATKNRSDMEELNMNFDDLLQAVAENTDLDQSIAAALDANTQLLRDALAAQGVDQGVIDDVVAQMNASNASTADAITRNTIADTTTPEPAPEPGTGEPA
jgi:DNA-binding GntR family transcriptional regulator